MPVCKHSSGVLGSHGQCSYLMRTFSNDSLGHVSPLTATSAGSAMAHVDGTWTEDVLCCCRLYGTDAGMSLHDLQVSLI